MLHRGFENLFRCRRRNSSRRPARPDRAVRRLTLEPLDARVTPAVVATFSPSAGVLTVFGDCARQHDHALSRDAAGKLLVNGGAVSILGGTATVANTALDPGLRPGRQRHHHPQRGQRRPAAGRTSSAAPATTS